MNKMDKICLRIGTERLRIMAMKDIALNHGRSGRPPPAATYAPGVLVAVQAMISRGTEISANNGHSTGLRPNAAFGQRVAAPGTNAMAPRINRSMSEKWGQKDCRNIRGGRSLP